MTLPSWIAARLARATVRVDVVGQSMLPTLSPGDRLLVRRSRRIHEGDIVAFADPQEPSRTLVKRVSSIDGANFVVLGDNRGASRDSRAFGEVAMSQVIGRVWYRYFPPEARGRVG